MQKKMLFVRVGRVGDMVMITAALKAAIKLCPDAEIHVLTSPDGFRVLKNFHANLTKLICYDRKKFFPYFQRKKIKAMVSAEKYDDIFCMETNPNYLKLLEGSGANIHLMENYDINQNYAKQCMQMVTRAENREDLNEWIYLPVHDTAIEKSDSILLEQGISNKEFLIAIHPSFSGLRKSAFRSQTVRQQRGWPLENYAKLAQLFDIYLTERNIQHAIITDLLQDERELGEQLVSLSSNIIKLFTPQPDFERYKATLHRCNMIVVPNTGPMHIAGAVGTPVVGLFAGQTPDDSGPYVAPDKFVAVCAEDMKPPSSRLVDVPVEYVFEMCKKFLPE